MIRFLDDIRNYPNAVIHRSTKNTSFLALAEKYRLMGVKNFYFHCLLLQPELANYDPHDPNLSEEIIGKMTLECKDNPWYFFRECLRIPAQGSPLPKSFKANRGNIALIWSFLCHIDPSLIQPRQTGKSVSVDGLMSFLLYVAGTNARINMLTKDNELRTANVNRLKIMRELLPSWLQMRDRSDSDNTVEIVCNRNGNRYSTAVSQNSEASALNVGRGLTAPLAYIDEGPFINYIDQTIPAMLTAGNAAREEARDNGYPYGTIFTTTAGKKDSRSGKYMYDIIHGAMPWTEMLFDAPDEVTLHRMVRANSRENKLMVNITMSHRQLGYTDEWLLENMRVTHSVGEAAERDYLNRWTSGGLYSPLPTSVNERIRNSCKEPLYSEIHHKGYMLRWYVPESQISSVMSSRKVIVAVDMSDALGGKNDGCSVVFVDSTNLDVLAAANLNRSNLIELTGYIADLMVKYENTILVPERRSQGQTLIDMLLIRLPAKGIDPFKRIYNVIVDDRALYQDDYAAIQTDVNRRSTVFYERLKGKFGFVTSGNGAHSRSKLYVDALNVAARYGSGAVHDKELVDQITSLVSKNGRIDHAEDGHDDMVIAWLLATWFLTSSKNLQFYGIVKPLSHAVEFNPEKPIRKALTKEELYEEQTQTRIKAEIESLLNQLSETEDNMITLKIEHRIKVLNSRLREEYSDKTSIDGLISQINSERNRRIQERQRKRKQGMQGRYNSGLTVIYG